MEVEVIEFHRIPYTEYELKSTLLRPSNDKGYFF